MKSPTTHFRLRPGESLAPGLRRIYCEQLEMALWQLRERPQQKRAVHNVRKGIKRLRALLRLMRTAIEDAARIEEDQRLRNAARRICAMRDAQVRLRTLEKLRKKYSGSRSALARTHRLLSDELLVLSANAAAPMDEIRTTLEAAHAEIDRWFPTRLKWPAVRNGMQRAYRRGRMLFCKARSNPSIETLHELRKRVKDLWHHLQLLRCIDRWGMKQQIHLAEKLSGLIGDVHDLAVLRESIEPRKLGAEGAALLALIDSHCPKLVRRVIQTGGELYDEKPKEFRKRIDTAAKKVF